MDVVEYYSMVRLNHIIIINQKEDSSGPNMKTVFNGLRPFLKEACGGIESSHMLKNCRQPLRVYSNPCPIDSKRTKVSALQHRTNTASST